MSAYCVVIVDVAGELPTGELMVGGSEIPWVALQVFPPPVLYPDRGYLGV